MIIVSVALLIIPCCLYFLLSNSLVSVYYELLGIHLGRLSDCSL